MGRKCDRCIQPLCLFSWITLLLGIGFGYLLIFEKCEIYSHIRIELNDTIIYIWTIIALGYPTLSAIIFIILTKCHKTYRNCTCLKVIWFLLHIILIITAIYKNATGHIHTRREVLGTLGKSRMLTGTPEKLPAWFINLQNDKKCCGVDLPSDYGLHILPETLIRTCNLPKNISNVIGCKNFVNEIYQTCRVFSVVFILVMAVFGVVPLIVYVLSHRSRVKQEAKEDAEEEAKILTAQKIQHYDEAHQFRIFPSHGQHSPIRHSEDSAESVAMEEKEDSENSPAISTTSSHLSMTTTRTATTPTTPPFNIAVDSNENKYLILYK